MKVVVRVGALVGDGDREVEVDDQPGKGGYSAEVAKQPAREATRHSSQKMRESESKLLECDGTLSEAVEG